MADIIDAMDHPIIDIALKGVLPLVLIIGAATLWNYLESRDNDKRRRQWERDKRERGG